MDLFLLEPQLFYRNNETHSPWCVESLFRFAKYYLTPVAIAEGIITNIFTILAFNSHKGTKKKLPGEICLTAIAISDIAFLATLLAVWLSIFVASVSTSDLWCLMTTYTFDITVFSTLWILVSLSITSIIQVCKPQWYNSLLTTRATVLLMVGIFVVAIIVYLNISLLKSIVLTPKGPACLTLEQFIETKEALGHIDLVVNFAIPYTTVLFVALVTLYRFNGKSQGDTETRHGASLTDPIIRNGSRREGSGTPDGPTHTRNRQNAPSSSHAQSAVIKMYLVTSALYLTCSAPCHVLQVVARLAPVPENPATFWHIVHWQQLLIFLFFMRPALSFWCLLLTNQYFRCLLSNGMRCKVKSSTNGSGKQTINIGMVDSSETRHGQLTQV